MEYKDLRAELQECESIQRLMRDKKGSATIKFKGLLDLEAKTTLTSDAVGRTTSGVLQIDRAKIVAPARRRLFMRDLLVAEPTSMQVVDFVRVSSDATIASPQSESVAKLENSISLATSSANVRTISTWLPATRQVLDDYGELAVFLGDTLRYAVRKEEDRQILNGDNAGQNLNGLINQASAFDSTLLVAGDGYEYADQLARAKQQLESADELDAGFVALNPINYWGIRLTKDQNGQYIYGSPSLGDRQFNIFGMTPIRSNAVASGTFLVGTTAPTAVVLRDRGELTVEVSTQHSDYFTRNMVAIRAEERVSLVVYRPGSFITGDFAQSPA